MDEKTIEALFATRREYAEDCQREKFHLDAYSGTGGFSGAVRATPSSYWGWAADAYSDSPWLLGGDRDIGGDTYLDRFDREDAEKFARRIRVVHYENHVEPCVDIPLSYLRRKPFTRQGVEAGGPLAAWLADATGDGTDWDRLVMGDILLRGAVTGMCPVMFDVDAPSDTGDRVRTKADDIAQGRRVRAIPLFGLNLLDYGEDDKGGIAWAKIRFDFCDRAGPLEPARDTVEIRELHPDRIVLHTFVLENGKRTLVSQVETANPFGVVPLAIFRPKPMPGDPVRGIATIQNIASEAKRLFNLHSELDEHIRKTVFAFLQIPCKNPAQASKIVVGNGNAMGIPQDSAQPIAWVSPSQDVSAVLEKRIENTVAAIYAMARLAFARGSIVSAAASGISRQYEFESTNRSVSDIARELAEFDQACLRIVSRFESPATMSTIDEIRTTAADDFGIEDLDRDLATAETAARGRLGGRLLAIVRQRLATKLAPNLTADDLEIINAEIDALAVSEQRAMAQADALADLGGAFPAGLPTVDGATSTDATDTESTDTPGDGTTPPDAATVEGEIAQAAAVEGGTVQPSGLAKDPTKNLNGAQLAGLLDIVERVMTGRLPKLSAKAILLVGFAMTEVDADSIIDPVPDYKAPAEAPPVNGGRPAPGGSFDAPPFTGQRP